jgi:hypothetical protein
MSKKLIAVASAAALALSALVGIAPATAMPFDDETLPVAGNSLVVTASAIRTGGTGTLADPYLVNVPSSGLATSSTMVRFGLSATASRAFTVTSTSGIKLLDAVANATNKYTAVSGAATLSGTTNASGTAEFYAFPTSTTKGVVTLTFDGDITQVYITGNVGPAYDIGTVTLPSLEPSKEGVIVAAVTDAFGNVIDTASDQSLTVTRVGTGVTAEAVNVQYSATSKRWEGTVTAGATAGQLAVGLTIAGLTATDDQKAAFGEPNNTFFGIITVGATKTVAELTLQVTELQAQLAALQIIKDRKVSKLKYNRLARKWNAAFPSNKVWVKP